MHERQNEQQRPSANLRTAGPDTALQFKARETQMTASKRLASNSSVRRRTRAPSNSGFSMMEILIVLAIMAVIASLVGPALFNQLDKSKLTAARTQIRTLESSLSTLRLEIGRFPTEAEGLAMLVTPPADPATRAAWRGPYLDDAVPMDPWGNPYRYTLPKASVDGLSTKPVVYSFGQDNQPGGTGMDADIGRVADLVTTTATLAN